MRNKKKVIAAYCEIHVHVYFACMTEWLVSIIPPRNMRYDKNLEFGIGQICLGYLPTSMGLNRKIICFHTVYVFFGRSATENMPTLYF